VLIFTSVEAGSKNHFAIESLKRGTQFPFFYYRESIIMLMNRVQQSEGATESRSRNDKFDILSLAYKSQNSWLGLKEG